MEVRIRLQRAGKTAKKRYNYRVVAISRTKSREGRHLDILGHYDPAKEPAVFVVDREKLDGWIKKGAQMSDTVRTLVKKLK
jgi:small subunit ribosomal protein S16